MNSDGFFERPCLASVAFRFIAPTDPTDHSPGTLFRASQFLSEELPIRLAHRVQDLGELPDGLSEMPSIKRVQDWYAQSFEVCSVHPLGFPPLGDS